jgi:hypothetical protein
MSHPYVFLGFILCVAGAILMPVFYFVVGSTALTAVALSAVMLGFTSLALSSARPYVSPETCRILLNTGMENTAALLEELGLRNKAIYLPPPAADKPARALIPLGDGFLPNALDYSSERLIVRCGVAGQSIALAIATPGGACVRMLEAKPGDSITDIESALTYLLTGVLDIADGADVRVEENGYLVEIRGNRQLSSDAWYHYCVGSPLASIAAAVTSYSLDKPVIIREESASRTRLRIRLEVLG